MKFSVSEESKKEMKKDELESIIKSRSELLNIGKSMLLHKLKEDDNNRDWFTEWFIEWIKEYYLFDEFTKFKKLSQDFVNKFPELEILFLIVVDDSVCQDYNLLYHFISTFFIENLEGIQMIKKHLNQY